MRFGPTPDSSPRAALKADKPKEAIAILTESLAEDHPSPPTAQAETYYLGLAYSKDGQSARASELLDRLAKTPAAPAAADAQFLVGQAHVEAGRYSEGVSALESYLKGKPDGDVVDYALAHLIQARIGLGELDAVFETLGRLSAKFPRSKVLDVSRVRAGEAALGAKQYERATEQFRLASESADPFTASRARLGLGWTLLDSGKADEAAASFGAFLASAPRDNSDAPEASLARARVLEAAKKFDDALQAYALTAKSYPKSDQGEDAALAHARLLSETKHPLEAAAAYAQFVQDHPGYKPKTESGSGLDAILADWGWSLNDADKPSEADKVFTRLLQEFPDSPHAADARFNLAESANQSKNYADVSRLLEPLIADGAKTPPRLMQSALYRLGRTQAETKNWPASAKTLDRLLTDFPETLFLREARLLRAEVALEADDPQTADTNLSTLGEPKPDDPPGFALAVRRRKVQSLLGLRKWDEVVRAADAFKADAPSDPLTSEVEYARGRALQQLARMEEARAGLSSGDRRPQRG